MDVKKLVIGLSVLAILAGAGLVGFAPGGLFNHSASVSIEMAGLGTMKVDAGQVGGGLPAGASNFGLPGMGMKVEAAGPDLGRPGPLTGFVLIGIGAVGFVVGIAMKPPAATTKPHPLS